MSETTSRRRGTKARTSSTRFDDIDRRRLVYALIGIGVLIIVVAALATIGSIYPDAALSFQLGGLPRASDSQPRNFRLWAVMPDGRLRFATAFFPLSSNAPASEVFTVAGPLVDKAEDMQETKYFGALNINSQVQSGPGNDSGRFFKLFWVEHDPKMSAYGIDIMTQNPPYIAEEKSDKSGKTRSIAMGAPATVLPDQKVYYAQVIVAVAFAPGISITNVAYAQPDETTGKSTDVMLRPYRRVTISGWTVYYFDQTLLTQQETVRLLFIPPDKQAQAPDLNLWDVDKAR